MVNSILTLINANSKWKSSTHPYGDQKTGKPAIQNTTERIRSLYLVKMNCEVAELLPVKYIKRANNGEGKKKKSAKSQC